MTRRDHIIKWLVYALGLLPVWILDAFVLARYPVWGVTPTLLPLAVAAVAVMEGATAGAGFGLGVGLFWELAYPGGVGGLVIGMTLAGLLVGIVAQYALRQNFFGFLICSAGLLAAQELCHLLGHLFIQAAPVAALLDVAIPEFLLSLAWTPVIFFIFRAVFRKVGRDKLA